MSGPPPKPKPPQYKFPPFPNPPPGVKVKKFTGKEASTVLRALNEKGNDVIDSLGIETLGPKPAASSASKSTTKKGDNTKKTWYDVWEEIKHMKVTEGVKNLQAISHPLDRFKVAAESFEKSLKWPPQQPMFNLRGHWDEFKKFSGLMVVEPLKGLIADPGEDDDDDDFMSDEEEFDGPPPTISKYVENNRAPVSSAEEDMDVDLDPTRKEDRASIFLKDIRLHIAIYLSSFLQRKGQFYNELSLQHIPHLTSIFLSYLISTHALPDSYGRSLNAALALAEKAKEELPRLHYKTELSITQGFPGTFSAGCKACFGGKTSTEVTGDSDAWGVSENTDAENHSAGDADGDGAVQASMEHDNGTESATGEWGDSRGSGWGESSGSGWGSTADSGWGTSTTDGSTNVAWGSNSAPKAPPPVVFKKPTIPLSLPKTHRTGAVEDSTRRIKAIMPSTSTAEVEDDGSFDALSLEEHFRSRYSQVVLSPWLDWNDPPPQPTGKGPRKKRDETDCPKLLPTSFAPDNVPYKHNSQKDDICILVDRKCADNMLLGIGIRATFVQLLRLQDGGNLSGNTEDLLWYVDSPNMMYPSFQTAEMD